MSTHDADGLATKDPTARRTMTRDPNAPGGVIIERGDSKDGMNVTTAGSTHLTTNIDGKWYVCNTRGERLIDTAFDTESEAVKEAQKHNHPDDGGASGETAKPAANANKDDEANANDKRADKNDKAKSKD